MACLGQQVFHPDVAQKSREREHFQEWSTRSNDLEKTSKTRAKPAIAFSKRQVTGHLSRVVG